MMGNDYYDYLIHEVQVVCNCPEDKAKEIVTYVNSFGSNPMEFIRRLPEYVGMAQPDADSVLRALEKIRTAYVVDAHRVCFPKGYANRGKRRKQNQKTKRRRKNER